MKKKSFLFVLIFLSSFDVCFSQSGWYQVPLPMNGTIWNIQFLNHNLGWIRMNDTANQNAYILRTTNGGNNFTIIGPQNVGKFYFFNDSLGYGLGVSGSNSVLSKTTNCGFNWTTLLTSSQPILCFYFINPDTGWIGMFDGANNSLIKRTTNGCQNFQTIWTGPGQGVDDILFTKPPVGGQYYGWINESGVISKTTNSGFNWTMTSLLYIQSMFFLSKDTGWVSTNNGGMLKTINAGLNWLTEYLPNNNVVYSIYFSNPRKGWGARGPYYIYATSNGGDVWGKQSIPILGANRLFFVDSLYGWGGSFSLIRTTDGGGPITQITNTNEQIPQNYYVSQNYPNPFNPQTTIDFSVKKNSVINLILYDITGKEMLRPVKNEEMKSGNYKIVLDFSRWNLSSGVYFYRFEALNIRDNIIFSQTKKMLFVK
ncbi:MAG: T9SS type A sorting domain-containing protein [Ignavibacteriae bacterium]|nr:T9SS type A sorting domain-containing protein [Ignavibacteriota bacterium]